MKTKKKAKPLRKTAPPKRANRATGGKGKPKASPGGLPAGTDPKRVRAILAKLDEAYPAVTCALNHENPYQLLISTILSAQCTDERVNMVTPALFAKYPTPEQAAHANLNDIENIIRSTGFFHSKAKSIQGASKKIYEEFSGQVPRTMDELLTLPGVARKTANVVLGTGFGIAVGVVVDTHVQRLSGRLDLTQQTDPKKIEKDLMQIIPQDKWILFSHQLIWHGRRVCQARKPRCMDCNLERICYSKDKII